MYKPLTVWGLLVLLLVSACASSSVPASGTGSAKAETKSKVKAAEDLSPYRPKFTAEEPAGAAAQPSAALAPANHVNERVQVLMDTVASANKAIKYAQGYRILAYTGTNRQTAMDLRKSILTRVPDEQDYLTYSQPTWRLKIGNYYNRLEAQQVLLQLRDIIPNAMVISDQIDVVKP